MTHRGPFQPRTFCDSVPPRGGGSDWEGAAGGAAAASPLPAAALALLAPEALRSRLRSLGRGALGLGLARAEGAAARCGVAMAAPASSAPPKKIVAPTVSQINAEYVTQVRAAAGAALGAWVP